MSIKINALQWEYTFNKMESNYNKNIWDKKNFVWQEKHNGSKKNGRVMWLVK